MIDLSASYHNSISEHTGGMPAPGQKYTLQRTRAGLPFKVLDFAKVWWNFVELGDGDRKVTEWQIPLGAALLQNSETLRPPTPETIIPMDRRPVVH